MQIQAVNSVNSMINCQPIKQPSSFSKRPTPDTITDPVSKDGNDETVIEQKYDLACRLAAYYKQQYEALLKSGSVVI